MSNQSVERMLGRWVQKSEVVLPSGTLVKAAYRSTSRGAFAVSFRTQIAGKIIVVNVIDQHLKTAINAAGSGFYRRILEQKKEQIHSRKHQKQILKVA